MRRAVFHFLSALLLLSGFSLILTGCGDANEEPQPNLEPQRLEEAEVLGFQPANCAPSTLADCNTAGCGNLDFVMTSNQTLFVSPGMPILGMESLLSPGNNFTEADVSFERTWIFQLNEAGQDLECATSEDCAAGFQCTSLSQSDLPGGSANAGVDRCVRQGSIRLVPGGLAHTAPGAPAENDNPLSRGLGYEGLNLILNMDNSGSLIGKLDDGVGPIDPAAATDRDAERLAAAKTFLAELTLNPRSDAGADAQLALLLMAGTGMGGVTDVFGTDNNYLSTFVGDETAPEDASTLVGERLDRLQQVTDGLTPVWEAHQLAVDSLSGIDNDGAGRVLTFVDSEPDGSMVSAGDAKNSLTSSGVEAWIVHLDSTQPEEPVLTGPLADYKDVACATGGYYIYDHHPRTLEDHFRRLGQGQEGRWSVGIEIQAEEPAAGIDELAPGWYRVATHFAVRPGDSVQTVRLSLEPFTSLLTETTLDRRILLHVE